MLYSYLYLFKYYSILFQMLIKNFLYYCAKPVYNNINENIIWYLLSGNPNAVDLLAKLDKKTMQENCKYFAEELIQYR
jgi:hypothetical protein